MRILLALLLLCGARCFAASPVFLGATTDYITNSGGTITFVYSNRAVVVFTRANGFSAFNGAVTINGPTNQVSIPALKVNKGTNSVSGLDINVDTSGKAMRVMTTADQVAQTPTFYIDNSGGVSMRTSLTVSGTSSGTGASYNITPPSTDPYMIGIWSDINGPAFQLKSTAAENGGYLISALNAAGGYVWNVEGWNGALTWGSTNAAAHTNYDVGLSRIGAGMLQVNNGTNHFHRDLQVRRLTTFGTGLGDSDDILLTNSNAGVTFKSDSSGASGGVYFKNSSGATKFFFGMNWQTGDGQFEISTATGAKLVIDPTTGYIGITTNVPAARLHLQHVGSNEVFAISGITNATPISASAVVAWIPVTLNGTNGFVPFYR